jgi:hypothetical protein
MNYSDEKQKTCARQVQRMTDVDMSQLNVDKYEQVYKVHKQLPPT